MQKTNSMKTLNPEQLVQSSTTSHAHRRMQQRGISDDMVDVAIVYGKAILKQGMTFYVLRERDLPRSIAPALRERVKDLVVVWSNETAEVVTCYKNRNGYKYVNRKTKRYIHRLDKLRGVA